VENRTRLHEMVLHPVDEQFTSTASFALDAVDGVTSLPTDASEDVPPCSERSLQSELADVSLLRAVPSTTALQGFGCAFRSDTGSISIDTHAYKLSRQVREIHDFISHDWATGRWSKTVLLLLVYNGPAGLIASLVTSAVVAALQVDSVALLPKPSPRKDLISGESILVARGMWCTLLGPLSFLVFLLFWQRIRRALTMPIRMLFVDKFCVDQVNDERKQAAILGLAAFLRHSKRLVVCWTPRYFTRLWCMYEIASWHHLEKDFELVEFRPVSEALLVFLSGSGACTYVLITELALLPFDLSPDQELQAKCLLLVIMFAIWIRATQLFTRELSLLGRQLAGFSITHSNCFCCANSHVRPDTFECIPCDRDYVYQALGRWHSSKTGEFKDVQRALADFDAYVQGEFRLAILKRAGLSCFPYEQMLYIAVPMLCSSFDLIAAAGSIKFTHLLHLLFGWYIPTALLVVPSFYKLVFIMLGKLDKIAQAAAKPSLDRILGLLNYLCSIILCFGLWLPLRWSVQDATIIATLAVDAGLLALTVVLFKPAWCCKRANEA